LNEYEWRTRSHARTEIQSRPEAEVLAFVKEWVSKLDKNDPAYERLRCEALWTQQSFHAVDAALLQQVLASPSSDARAAATRVLADERDLLPEAFNWLKAAALDPHPRVRTEALRGLSFIPTAEAAAAVLASLQVQPADPYVQYTGEAALGANLANWRAAYLKGELAKNDAAGKKLLDAVIATDKKGAELVPYLQILLGKDPQSDEAKNKAIQSLADMKGGNAENGKLVFRRGCIACHKVFGEGAEFGPDMMKVATRLKKEKIVESIIDPNAEVDKKYLASMIVTDEGKIFNGLVVKENEKELEIFDGKQKTTIAIASIEERRTLKSSSMPEGLAGTISPVEFLDLLAFLGSLK
jgi:putative heme-binding domain-containing protein